MIAIVRVLAQHIPANDQHIGAPVYRVPQRITVRLLYSVASPDKAYMLRPTFHSWSEV